jgi:hypothetical protein
MLYVVSGFMRTGTSMMMKALEAGGMNAAYRQSREVMRKRFADEEYDPNIGGLFELERKDYQEPDFPAKYDGQLIKCLNMGVPRMNVMPQGIRVVFMRREFEEVRQSYMAFFGHNLEVKDFEDRMRRIAQQIVNRKDVASYHEFWFRKVVEQPFDHFEILARAGWPIDPVKCVAVVDPQYCRYKNENLEKGVI